MIAGAYKRLSLRAPVSVRAAPALLGGASHDPDITTHPGADGWAAWLQRHAPGYLRAPFAARHLDFWRWVASVQAGERPRPFIAIWPRGGGKSTSAELATACLCVWGVRRYAVYVSGSQAKADQHVEAIGQILEALGVERQVGKYGTSRGWRRSRLRARIGGHAFTVDAYGLDTGARGAKENEQRPDLIIFDDIDEIHDSGATTRRKIETLTQTLLPMGTDYAAVLGVQNLIHSDSVFAQLADGRAKFLSDRIVSGPHVALTGYEAAAYLDEDGQERYRVAGSPTWEGQGLAACQRLVDTIGPDAFERESQQGVRTGIGRIYDVFSRTRHTCPSFTIPPTWQRFCGLDFGGINTVALLLAEEPPVTTAQSDGTTTTTPGRLYVYRAYAAGKRTGREHADAILAGEPSVPFCVGGSGSEDQWRLELRRGGLPVNAPDVREVEIGIDRVYGAFKRGELVIFDDLEPVIAQVEDYRRPLGPSGEILPGIYNKAKYHYCDALRYIVGRIRRG